MAASNTRGTACTEDQVYRIALSANVKAYARADATILLTYLKQGQSQQLRPWRVK